MGEKLYDTSLFMESLCYLLRMSLGMIVLCWLFPLGTSSVLNAREEKQIELREEKLSFEGVDYRICRIKNEGLAHLEVAWIGGDGKPMRSFDKVQAYYQRKGQKVRFITNAGIFEPGGVPTGLHIQSGKTLRPMNLGSAHGNFYLKPNGVCSIDGKGARIEDSQVLARLWLDSKSMKGEAPARLAVQSGPLLLNKGKIHPAFRRASNSKLHRNGVGVNDDGLVFAITTGKDGWVNLHGFARLFQHLGCKSALFLDGDISQMEVNPSGKLESNLFGAMFVLVEPMRKSEESQVK